MGATVVEMAMATVVETHNKHWVVVSDVVAVPIVPDVLSCAIHPLEDA